MATHWTLGCDAADPQALAGFWAGALGYVAEPGYDDPDGASIVDPDGAGSAIGFLRVPEGKTAKNRMHIDVRVAGEPPWDLSAREQLIRTKAAELVAAGATTVREHSYERTWATSRCETPKATSSASPEAPERPSRRLDPGRRPPARARPREAGSARPHCPG